MPAAAPADILRASGLECDASGEVVGAVGPVPVVRIAPADVTDALVSLADGGFDLLVDLFGTDTGEDIELTYHVRALERGEDVFVKASVPYDGEAPSSWRVYPAALYAEREAAEMFGMSFPGHPNPRRLLTVEGVGPLLRRSVPVRTAEEVQLP